jgi:hypothetical protein
VQLVAAGPPRSGDAVAALAKTRLGDRYVFGQRVPLADATWPGPWDCAEFASWCVFHATGRLYGTRPSDDAVRADAFTGFWGEQARADRATVDVALAARTPGALVLRLPAAGRTGHIVVSDGQGGTLEAHSSARGVVTERLGGRRWDFGILVPGVAYFAADRERPLAAPPKTVLRVTTPLLRGERVRALQQKLAARGFEPGPLDGIYGPQTASAVARFQAGQGLVADGEAGPLTLRALRLR